MFSYIKRVNSYIKGGYKACHEPAVFQENKVTLHVHFVKGFVVAIPAFKNRLIFCPLLIPLQIPSLVIYTLEDKIISPLQKIRFLTNISC